MNLFSMDDKIYEDIYGKYYTYDEFCSLHPIIRLDVQKVNKFSKEFVSSRFGFVMQLLLMLNIVWGSLIIYFSYKSSNWYLLFAFLSFFLFPNIKETALRMRRPIFILFIHILIYSFINLFLYLNFGFFNLLSFYFLFGSILWVILISSEIIYEILAKNIFLNNSLFYDKALNEGIIKLYIRI